MAAPLVLMRRLSFLCDSSGLPASTGHCVTNVRSEVNMDKSQFKKGLNKFGLSIDVYTVTEYCLPPSEQGTGSFMLVPIPTEQSTSSFMLVAIPSEQSTSSCMLVPYRPSRVPVVSC
jgi:hypothetical protein